MKVTTKFFVLIILATIALSIFSISASADSSSNDTMETASTLNKNSRVYDNIANENDVDYFKITLTEAGKLDINFSHDFFNDTENYWTVSFMNDSGDVFVSYNVSGKTDTLDLPSLGLPAGTYYLYVRYYIYFTLHYWNSSTYCITTNFQSDSMYEKEKNDDITTATPIETNTIFSGTIMSSSDIDYYKLILNQDGVLNLNFSHEFFNDTKRYWKISLWDKKCNEILSIIVTGKDDVVDFPSIGLTAGTYYIEVNDYSYLSTIPYSIIANFQGSAYWEKESVDNTETKIRLYKTYYGSTSSSSDQDWYVFELSDSGTFDIRLDTYDTSTSNNSYYNIYLYDSRYNQLGNKSVYLTTASNTLTVNDLTSGKYFVKIVSGRSLSTDKYGLTVSKNHTCSGSWKTETYPSCTSGGYEENICRTCGKVLESRYTAPNGHKYSEYISKDNSSHSVSCSVCDYERTINHVWDSGVVTTAPTCTTTGVQTHTCTYCLHTVEKTIPTLSEHVINEWETTDDANHKTMCDCGEFTYAPHTFVEEIDVLPLCETEGVMKLVCSDCGYTKSESIDKAGHSFNDWITSVPSTCTETGTERRDCINCDHYETRSASSLGHDYMKDWTVDVEPACETVGSKSRHCTRCEDKIDVIEIIATGHYFWSWSYDSEYYDGAKRPTCTDEGIQYRRCNNCNFVDERIVTPYGHYYYTKEVYIAPTCTEDGKRYYPCQRCNDTESKSEVIPATGHIFTNWSISKEPTCTEPGTEGSHCSACGEYTERSLNASGHTYDSEWTVDVNATCQNDGSKSHHCYWCGDKSDITIIKSDGHNFDAWQTIVEPTTSKEGSQTRCCKDCGYSETAPIAKSQGLTSGAVAAISVSSTAVSGGGIAAVLWYLWKKKLLFFK